MVRFNDWGDGLLAGMVSLDDALLELRLVYTKRVLPSPNGTYLVILSSCQPFLPPQSPS
jgi:hypothetical protein